MLVQSTEVKNWMGYYSMNSMNETEMIDNVCCIHNYVHLVNTNSNKLHVLQDLQKPRKYSHRAGRAGDCTYPPKQIVAIWKCRNTFVSRHLSHHHITTSCGKHSTKFSLWRTVSPLHKLSIHWDNHTVMTVLPNKHYTARIHSKKVTKEHHEQSWRTMDVESWLCRWRSRQEGDQRTAWTELKNNVWGELVV